MSEARDIVVVLSASFLLSALCSGMISRFGQKVSLLDTPNERSSHSTPTPRGGGIGIWLSFALTGLLFTGEPAFALTAGAMGVVGLLDDCYALAPKIKLLLQVAVAVLVVALFAAPAGFVAGWFFVLFIVGTANFFNFMDGINGMAGLSGAVGFGLLGFFALFISEEPAVAVTAFSMAAACLGFLPFNVPKAKVFMGDVGSVLLGFVFAALVVRLSRELSVFVCLVMFLCTFYADTLITIFYRWREGQDLMAAHRGHLYQYLCNERGGAHWRVSAVYAVIQGACGLLSLAAYALGIVYQVGLAVLIGAAAVIFYRQVKGGSRVSLVPD